MVFLRRNLAWMVLAFALAASLWGFVTTQQNPDVLDVFQAIPVEVRNLPADLTVRSEIQPVRVTVSAPRDIWQELRPAKFQASVDLSRVGPGLQEIPVTVQTVDTRARVEDITPAKALIHLEPIRRKDVPTRTRFIGEVPAGYQVGQPKVTPETVTVTGPQSLVDQVVAVVAEVSLVGATASLNQVHKAIPFDGRGDRVDRVAISSENLLVELRIEQERAFKLVPLAPKLTGALSPGYQIVELRVDPSAITVEGDPKAIEPVNVLPTTPIELNGATGDVSANASVQLPDGVRLARAQPVVVRVFVSPIESTVTLDVAPTVQDVSPRMRVDIVPTTIRLTLIGPMPVLSTLRARDVTASLSAGGLQSGVHPIRPRIDVPALVRLQQVSPENVELRLSLIEPTPSPSASPSVTPSATPGRG